MKYSGLKDFVDFLDDFVGSTLHNGFVRCNSYFGVFFNVHENVKQDILLKFAGSK